MFTVVIAIITAIRWRIMPYRIKAAPLASGQRPGPWALGGPSLRAGPTLADICRPNECNHPSASHCWAVAELVLVRKSNR